ncbi:Transcription factor GRAS [Artemisia annua]|uniref:Transcription factor GRAS n=1 Tax=Artemisia annua TaxID=35608 RepID=A0A2U1PXM5_ARTAN|nr:Transcription factor GRAS [Artemisia annua]
MEEANKFLPTSKPLVIDLGKYDLPQDSRYDPPEVVVKVEKTTPSNGLKGRKHYQSEDRDYEEERSSKQSAVYVEEDELSEMFDRALLGPYATGGPVSCCNEMPIPTYTKSLQNPLFFKSVNLRTVPIMYRAQREDIISSRGEDIKSIWRWFSMP